MLVFLATCATLPHLSRHEPRVIPALHALGLEVEVHVWSDPGVRWQRADLVVVRTCWDDIERPEEFLRWLCDLESLQVRVKNDPSVIRWNLSKSYLFSLQGLGGHRLPRTLPQDASTFDLARLGAFIRSCQQVVAKPQVSAGALDTWRIDSAMSQQDAARLQEIVCVQDRPIFLQEFLPAVVNQGEWSCVFFGHTLSHGVLKTPGSGDFRVQDEWGASVHLLAPPPQVVAEATSIMETLFGALNPLLYARIDLVEDKSSTQALPWLMECELIEPELFLQAPGAPKRFAQAVMHECMNA